MSAITSAVLATEASSGWAIAVTAGALLAFALVSRRLHGSPVSPAMVFVALGLLLGTEGLDIVGSNLDAAAVRLLAEVTLALVLFTDAASIHIRALARESSVPLRLLLIGLPLTIAAGALAGLALFPTLGVFEVLILAIVLAPTDAALGEPVVADERLPSFLRQGLNVESGLNDGICVPLLFAAITMAQLDRAPEFDGEVVVDLVKEVVVAASVGVAASALGAVLLKYSVRRGWIEGRWVQSVPLATVAIAYTVTAELGGSGFVAAFAAGLAYRLIAGHDLTTESVPLLHELGGVLSAVTFFVFAGAVVGPAVFDLGVTTVVYAVLSLTMVRMVPVGVALLGTELPAPTVAFAGWFGPRGLASIVFALIIVDDAGLPGTPLVVQVTAVTVLISVFAHGATAPWLVSRFVGWSEGRASRSAPMTEPGG
ncbi:MAG TPA: cation:proton antiporter [Acidimicrobiales bacterium]